MWWHGRWKQAEKGKNVECNEENLQWAILQVQRLESLYGFPRTEPGLTQYARELLRIVRNKEFTHSRLGTGNDVDWIIGEIMKTEVKFPPIAIVREMYKNEFCPADEEQKG